METDAKNERPKFVHDAVRDRCTMADVCACGGGAGV
jgi:hypothetical protein